MLLRALDLRTALAVIVLGCLVVVGQAQAQDGAGQDAGPRALEPAPSEAKWDRSRAAIEGCVLSAPKTRSGPCEYGDPDGRRTIVLFGDSHAAQFFPSLNPIAKKRGWRLVVLSKSGCPPYRQLVHHRGLKRPFTECAQWRQDSLKRIVDIKPDLVVTAGWIWHRSVERGRTLRAESPRNRRTLARAYRSTLERLRRAGIRSMVMRETPRAPRDIPRCVGDHPHDLWRCDFPLTDAHKRQSFERRVARQVRGTRVANLVGHLCPGGLCRAVIGNRITFRDRLHLTATYARTLERPLARQIGNARR